MPCRGSTSRAAPRRWPTTQAVVPVSWEISCNLCHDRPGFASVAADILEAHDRLHKTDLQNHKPVLCASCHADPALGTAGVPGVSTMSSAMHTAHATRFTDAVLAKVGGINCYACHPGMKTQCQRDIHYSKGIHCGDCHGSMAAVGSPSRTPWVDEPKCANCHNVPGHQYEEPGKLFKQSRGHNGVMCARPATARPTPSRRPSPPTTTSRPSPSRATPAPSTTASSATSAGPTTASTTRWARAAGEIDRRPRGGD